MKKEPLFFVIPIEDFDISKLPHDADALKTNRELLESSISDYFAEQFKAMGGEAKISISKGVANIQWMPESGFNSLIEHGIGMLQAGDSINGAMLLKLALSKMPNNPLILFNLGMALSDQNKLDEAIALLDRCVSLQPDNAPAYNALGVAYSRNHDMESAEKALRRSLELEPDDGYARRNLGGIIIRKSPKEGLTHLKRAAELLPNDQQAQYGYGLALFENNEAEQADTYLQKAIDLAPLTQVAEEARTLRTKLAHKIMRGKTGTTPRMDVVMYCLAALQLFAKSPDKRQPVTFEIAMKGRSGLDINDPVQKYTLSSLPGTFSGMQLVSYMYVGMKQLDPTIDPGIDLSQELEHAKQLFGGK